MANILIIDDDEQICQLMAARVSRQGHEAKCAHTLAGGLDAVHQEGVDLIFLDVSLPDGNGLDVLPDLMSAPCEPEVIIITGMGDPDGAEIAIKSGAWGYVEKGAPLNTMLLTFTRALKYREEKRASRPPVALKHPDIVGNSPPMQACYDLLAQASASGMNVLISGDTGTGKELFAQAIHDNSSRSCASFVVVDCAALPETLVESILFGHEKGAFTGAHRYQEGLVKQADKGTLFLDEVGELPLAVQKAFLRVLQERKFRMVGGDREIDSDFRLVAATNRDLEQMVAAGGFRNDLLFRLRAMEIHLPPLKEHPEDIKALVNFHVSRLCERYGIKTKGYSQGFIDALAAYAWPGNVRELVSALEQAITASGETSTIFQKHLPEGIRVALARASLSAEKKAIPLDEAPAAEMAEELPPMREMMKNEKARLEKWYLVELMNRTDGDIPEACRVSGLCRSVLYSNLKKYGISRRG